jgi:hypothetical protein
MSDTPEDPFRNQAVTKLDQVAPITEPTLLQPSLPMQQKPVEYDRGSIVFSGNSFGECVMINVESSNCVGAGRWFSYLNKQASSFFASVKQTTHASKANQSV